MNKSKKDWYSSEKLFNAIKAKMLKKLHKLEEKQAKKEMGESSVNGYDFLQKKGKVDYDLDFDEFINSLQ
jgi:hypothetical protein